MENEACESEVNADNQVILVIPADIDDADVERFIADNMTSVPPSYTIKRESVADDTMNGLDVLVQIAVEDEQMHKQQLETSNTNVFDQVSIRNVQSKLSVIWQELKLDIILKINYK